MPSRRQIIRHQFVGGWATDFGTHTEVGVDQNGLVQIPFLVDAENIRYEADGGIHKIGGAIRTNSSAINNGQQIMGIFDYWRGDSGPAQQRIIIHTGELLMNSDDMGSTFTEIFSGLSNEAIPSYATFDDILIISSDGIDVPLQCNQIDSVSLLGTNTPNFSFSEPHKNRLWAAGVKATGSRLYYSPDLPNGGPTGDWDGSTSGTIEIDPGDGDVITGLASHRNELWVFKGPNTGSIHRITGSSPTGSDGFARRTFVRGIGAVNHRMIFRFKNDLGFVWADGSIRSLNTTDAFGDFDEASLSRPIRSYLQDRVFFHRLNRGVASTNENLGGVLIAMPIDGSNFNNQIFYMDFRFTPVRWAQWPALGTSSVVSAITHYVDTSQRNQIITLAGGDDGFVRRLDQRAQHIDTSTAYTGKATTPFISYGNPFQLKTIYAASLGVRKANTSTITFGWRGDITSQQTQTSSVAIGPPMGTFGSTVSTDFTLDRDTLGEASFAHRFLSLETGGEFRAVQYELSNGIVDQDLNISTFGAQLRFGPESLENE